MTDTTTPLMTEPTQKDIDEMFAVMEADLAVRDANSPERVALSDAHTMGKVVVQQEVQKITVQ